MTGVAFTIRADDSRVRRDLRRLPKIAKKIARQELNRVTREVRTRAARDSAKDIGAKVGGVRNRIKFRLASPRRLASTMFALILPLRGHDIGKPRQTRKGVKIRKHFFPGGFVGKGNLRAGGRRVGGESNFGFQRTGAKRLPIREVTVEIGPTVTRHMTRLVNTFAIKRFLERWDIRMTRELNRRRGR